jgi:hypothetical protein
MQQGGCYARKGSATVQCHWPRLQVVPFPYLLAKVAPTAADANLASLSLCEKRTLPTQVSGFLSKISHNQLI